MSILKKDQTNICPVCNSHKIFTVKYCSKECKSTGVAKSCKDTFIKNFGVSNPSKEVKSAYTHAADLEKNLLKQQACINDGFNFEFMIFVKGMLQ
jgi:hypothetical protein